MRSTGRNHKYIEVVGSCLVASTSAILKNLIYIHVSFELSLQLRNILTSVLHNTFATFDHQAELSPTSTSTVVKPLVSRFAGRMKLSSTLRQAANRQLVAAINQHNRAVILSRDSFRRIWEILHDNSPDSRRKVGQILQNIRTQLPIPKSSLQPLRLPMHATPMPSYILGISKARGGRSRR